VRAKRLPGGSKAKAINGQVEEWRQRSLLVCSHEMGDDGHRY
jgi:hypothetical protein